MDPETIRAWAPIIGAIITGIFGILTKGVKLKMNWFIVVVFAIVGGVIGYFIGLGVSTLPINFGRQEGFLPPKILSQTPTPIPRGQLVMEINFNDHNDGICNKYDPNLLGYEKRQYYIRPEPRGWIAICHENDYLEPEGSLQVSAFPDSDLQGLYGYAVLFGWAGENDDTTDGCIFGIRRQGATTHAFFEQRDEGKRVAYTQELRTINLDNAPHTLRVALDRDGKAVGYLDERYFAEYKFSECNAGPIGMMAWGPGENKIYFDNLKLFGLP